MGSQPIRIQLGKILQENVAESSCGKILWEILAGKFCRKFLWENHAGNSWKMLRKILAGKSGGKFLQENLAGNAAGNAVGNLAGNLVEKVFMVYNGSKNGKKIPTLAIFCKSMPLVRRGLTLFSTSS